MPRLLFNCAAAVLFGSLASGAFAETIGGQLRISNWIEYLPKDVLQQFTSETGVEIVYDVFDSSQTLEARLLTGTSGYDLAFPSSSQIPQLIAAGALMPLEPERLPHFSGLDAGFMRQREPLDPGSRYSVPYLWGTTLIGFNKAKVKLALGTDTDMRDYDLLFKPENIAKLSKCGVAFLDSPNEVIPIVMHYMGLDPNNASPEDYGQVEKRLMSIRPYVRYFNSAKYPQDLANGDICVALGWSGAMVAARNMANAAGNGNEIQLALPRQGTLAWSDDMVIPKGAKNVVQAHAFIDYLLRPEVIAKVTNEIGYPNPTPASLEHVDPRLLQDEDLFVPEGKRSLLFQTEPAHKQALRVMTRIWNRVRSGV